MEITGEQENLMRGHHGRALSLAMKTLIQYGRAFGAKRMVPIKSAHIAGSFGVIGVNSYFHILQRLALEGVKVKVPTTINPAPGGNVSFRNKIAFSRQKRLERLFQSLGVMPNYTCACYLDKNIPAKGDFLAWAESSAVQYANSVIGARTNRNSILIDICSAVTGYTPEFGYLLDENRRGRMLIRLDIKKMDASALGFLLGKMVVDKVPVLEHYPFNNAELKNMGGAMAASGGVALFHVEGVTPEAPDLLTAFQGPTENETVIAQQQLDSLRYKGSADMVVFGCPHMSYEEALKLAPFFSGRKVSKPTWFCMAPSALERFKGTDMYRPLQKSGVKLQTCCPVSALSPAQGLRSKKILTSSGKCYYYLEGSHYGTEEDCLKASGVMA